MNIIAPKGTKDLFKPEILKWQYLESRIREFFSRYLYQEIRTPIFEHSELFHKGTGSETEIVQKEMYTFRDKADRSITLRPENTPSVVRAIMENNLLTEIFPIRFFYIGPMFRYDKPQKGRFRQFHQFGIEIFGDASAEADAELIFSAFGFLKDVKIENITIHINSVGCPQCRPGYLTDLQAAARTRHDELCSDCQRKVSTNPLRIFDCKQKQCIDISDDFPKITDHLCQECRQHFSVVRSALSTFGVPYALNPRLVRGLDYYTRTVFEITSNQLGAQDALLGGGRYDNLFQELGGKDMPATGFAAGMERIILHLDKIPETPNRTIFIAYQHPDMKTEAIKLSAWLREKGLPVYMDYNARNIKKQFKKSARLGAAHTFILGEDEIASRSVSIKEMATGEQTQIKTEDLESWLQKNT
jgi:histidyl-tRNA synthetase